jgi:hypothetical protein
MNKPLATIIILILLLVPAGLRAANDSLYFLYQRSVYLENLSLPGGWWANPALIGETSIPTAYTINVSPLADVYTLASAKFLFPVASWCGAGIGIMGTGISSNQSAQVSNGGGTYKSKFSFSNPSFQMGFGVRSPGLGSIGILADIGAEKLPVGPDEQQNFLVLRGGAGVLTKYYFDHVSLSATVMSTLHFWDHMYVDNNGKLGMRFRINEDLVLGSWEYTFSFTSGAAESFYRSASYYYEVFKTVISIRLYKIAGAIIGFSNDFGQFSDIGKTIHLGIELRPSDVYPFCGGYEIGISTYQRDYMIHRFWIGYCFQKKTGSQPGSGG